jgi:hypothetical protein
MTKTSDQYRENAERCAELADGATNEPSRLRYKRMEAAWTALAQEQDWLEGEISPKLAGSAAEKPSA